MRRLEAAEIPPEIGTPAAKCWDCLWSRQEIGKELDGLSMRMLSILSQSRERWADARVLEAGSGTGRISLRLAALGAKVSLVDMSSAALGLARRFSERSDASFVMGNILRLPFPDGSFDVTWNGGVLEHLSRADLEIAVAEMTRVTKSGGHVVSFNPNRQCIPYRLGKRLLESGGRWPYGFEEPIRSLEESFIRYGVDLVEEYDIGVARSFSFIPHVPRVVLRELERIELMLHLVGVRGYLLVSIGKKR